MFEISFPESQRISQTDLAGLSKKQNKTSKHQNENKRQITLTPHSTPEWQQVLEKVFLYDLVT